jgi:hypothetical protein
MALGSTLIDQTKPVGAIAHQVDRVVTITSHAVLARERRRADAAAVGYIFGSEMANGRWTKD